MNAVLSSGIDDRGARPRPVAQQNLSKPMKFPDSLGDTSRGRRRSPQMEIIITSRAIIVPGILTWLVSRVRENWLVNWVRFLSNYFANLRSLTRARSAHLASGVGIDLTPLSFSLNNTLFAIHVPVGSFYSLDWTHLLLEKYYFLKQRLLIWVLLGLVWREIGIHLEFGVRSEFLNWITWYTWHLWPVSVVITWNLSHVRYSNINLEIDLDFLLELHAIYTTSDFQSRFDWKIHI